jgi:hypothetical protein
MDSSLTPIRVAFIIDNVVQDVINTDDRLAAIFLSNPTVIDITDKVNSNSISVNSSYDPLTGEFSDAPPLIGNFSEKIEGSDIIVDDSTD